MHRLHGAVPSDVGETLGVPAVQQRIEEQLDDTLVLHPVTTLSDDFADSAEVSACVELRVGRSPHA